VSTGSDSPGGATPGGGTPGSWSEETGPEAESDETSTGEPFPCSYGLVIYAQGGKTYVVKISQGSTTCTFTNKTSNNRHFSYTCNGDTFSNPGYILNMNGSPVPIYTGPQPCSAFFTVSGRDVWAKAGVTIISAVAKSGSFATQYGQFCPPVGGVTHVVFPSCDKD
jgi:hypothetical protein